MTRKAVFFDIDGTIWNGKNEIPESTIAAIQGMRKNGHLAFLCSGRCRGYIQSPKLLSIGFDGIVAGCGTMIEYKDETIFYKRLDNELAEYTINTVRKYGFRPILEGREYLYMDDFEFGHEFYGQKLKAEMGERLLSIAGHWGKWEISKLSCATNSPDKEICFSVLEPYYDFMIHNADVAEMVPKGYHKGIGIQKVCELLDVDIADTFAFGDSTNDLGMFQTAGIAVAMGNGSDIAKAAADYVTTALMDNGIWNACKKFKLI